ncbi:hypothetical protein PFISCL1PPCAC_6130, partial [Pristionchus fissidentatus]
PPLSDHSLRSFFHSSPFSLLSTMLGMMNSPSDGVEFYACNPGKSSQQLSAEDTKAFTEPKEKPQTSYTPDGRMIVDGKVVEGKAASTLWTGILLRSAVNHMPLLNSEKKKKEEKEEEREEKEGKEEITPVNEAVLTTAPPQSHNEVESTQ